MRTFTSIRANGLYRLPAAGLTGLLLASGACTLLLDHSSVQCQSDSDCTKFGGHPLCRNSVCVDSGLGPSDCFLGTPQQPGDFLNQCSTAQCLSFDNCQRLQICVAGVDDSPPLIPPPKTDAGASSGPTMGLEAGTLTACLDPNNGRAQVVFINGSSNFPPLLAQIAPLVIAAGGPTPVFQITSSCQGVKSIFSSNPTDHMLKDPLPGSALSKYAAYFNADGTQVPCTLGPSGATTDLGESDIFSSTCAGFEGSTDGVNESFGPMQAMAFVVPGASGQTTISEEAAREVFGMAGMNGVAAPWTNPQRYFIRNANTGTQQLIGHAINVPADQFWGIDQGTASAMDKALKVLTDPTEAEQAIGIISVDYYDNDRGNLKALAYKAAGQECAYLPDSTSTATDKRNVRDGHYPIWGPVHFFSAGNPPPAGALAFLSVIAVPHLDPAVLDAYIGASLVPTCAMSVQRTAELGPLTPYTPPFGCGCYFDSKKGTLPAECTPCNANSDCPATRPACNLNFCEVQ